MNTKLETTNDYQERINKIMVFIQNNLDEPLLLDDLAKIACFSKFHIHKIFHAYTGETLHNYVRRLKLERAVSSLRNTDRSITDIAMGSGYDTPASFAKAFKQLFDYSPTECRQAAHEEREPDERYNRKITTETEDRITMIKPIRIETIKPIRVLFLRGLGSYFETPEIVFPKLTEYARKHGLITATSKLYGIAHDCPEITAEEKIRFDACISVDNNVKADGEFGIQNIPGGKYAIFEHKGIRDKVGETLDKIIKSWLPQSNYQLREVPLVFEYPDLEFVIRGKKVRMEN